MRLLAPLFASALLAALALASTAVAQPLSLTINNKTVLPVDGSVASPVVAGSLDAIEDLGDAATLARQSFDSKLASAGLPTTVATAARVKNVTTVPARAKAASAVKTLRNAADAIVDGAWDKTALLESAAVQAKSDYVASNVSDNALTRDKAKEIIVAGKNASLRARETKRGIADALFSSGKGKKMRFSVLVSLDPQYHPQGGNGVEVPDGNDFFGPSPVGSLVTPATFPIRPAMPGAPNKATVSFSAEVVAGLEGNTYFTPSVVDPSRIANVVRAMLVSELRRLASKGEADASALLALGDGSSEGKRTAAPLLSAQGVALDGGQGVYLVRVSFPALLPGLPLPIPATKLPSQLINAVNAAASDNNPCSFLEGKMEFDVCDMVDDGTHLLINKVSFLAFETDPGAADTVGGASQLLPFGRRSKLDNEAAQSRQRSNAVAIAGPAASNFKVYAAPSQKTVEDYTKLIFDSGIAQRGLDGLAKIYKADGDKGKTVATFFEAAAGKAAVLGASFTLFSTIAGFTGLFGPSAQEITNNYLKEINATTQKTLEGVIRIEVTLTRIETEIFKLESDIKKLGDDLKQFIREQVLAQQCYDALLEAEKLIDLIRTRWEHYTNPVDGPRYAVMKALNSIQNGKQPNPQPALIYDDFVKDVLDAGAGSSVEDAVGTLQGRLVRGAAGGSAAPLIKSCAGWYLSDFRRRGQDIPAMMFSFDDRQYFNPINNLVRFYTIWMARGLHMIQDAWLFRAQQRALNAWAENQAVPGCNTTSPTVDRSLCIINAEQLPPAGSLFCVRLQASDASNRLPNNVPGFEPALRACARFDQARERITGYAQELQEYAGIPYSWGNKGEGVRLVLGSDVTGRRATLWWEEYYKNAPSGTYTGPRDLVLFNESTRTEWLVPASLEAFSPSCGGRIPCEALQGTWSNQTLLDPQIFGYPLNYQAALWQPAGHSVWNLGLRGIARTTLPSPNFPGAHLATQFLKVMETGSESNGAVPFSGMTDRQWWVTAPSTQGPGLCLAYCPYGSTGCPPGGRNIPADDNNNVIFELCSYGKVTYKTVPQYQLSDRFPALRLTDLIAQEVALNRSTGRCIARWDDTGSIPVRCGSDKTRYLVANLGSNGLADVESWPALDANNATATTAVVELFQDGGEVRVRCSPRWIHRDGSRPQSEFCSPVVQSMLVTQTAGPVYVDESPLAFASKTKDLYQDQDISSRSVSFSNAFSTNSSSPKDHERYLPRVITCLITADDPGNNGLPVYVAGQYVALANASSPLGIELRPNFVFPL